MAQSRDAYTREADSAGSEADGMDNIASQYDTNQADLTVDEHAYEHCQNLSLCARQSMSLNLPRRILLTRSGSVPLGPGQSGPLHSMMSYSMVSLDSLSLYVEAHGYEDSLIWLQCLGCLDGKVQELLGEAWQAI